MIINIDTTQPMSPQDLSVLRALTGDDTTPPPSSFPTDVERAESEVAKPAAKPAKAATAKKAVAAEKPAEDLRVAAIARASELLAAGERDRVTAALAEVGAARVSEVSAEQMPEFLKSLTD